MIKLKRIAFSRLLKLEIPLDSTKLQSFLEGSIRPHCLEKDNNQAAHWVKKSLDKGYDRAIDFWEEHDLDKY